MERLLPRRACGLALLLSLFIVTACAAPVALPTAQPLPTSTEASVAPSAVPATASADTAAAAAATAATATAATAAAPTEPATAVPTVGPAATSAPVPTQTATAEAAAGPDERIAAVESSLLPAMYLASEGAPALALGDRMTHYNVPGLSLAVIDQGRIDWAQGYGVLEAGTEGPVDEDTLFQAASISKPVTALVALRLVQSGQLSLDEDVNAYLRSWKLPDSPLAQTEKVTLRRLLNHTAGLTVNGFPGYAPGEPLPTVAEILGAAPPANTPPVRLRTVPGEVWNYSGGGYVLVQQLIEDVTGKPFARVAQEEVLGPLGMTRSAFSQPLPDEQHSNAASGHDRAGRVLPGGGRVYPELAPAGLWSTPSDLARFALALQSAARGDEGAILSRELAREMLAPGLSNWGLGVQLGGPEGGKWFAHGGSNAGYRARMVAFVEGDKGAVVMTNGDQGIDLFNEVLRAVAEVYDWPDLKAQAKTVVPVDPAVLQSLAGRYETIDDPGYGFEIAPEGTALRVTTSEGASLFQPESDLVYFDLESGLTIIFTRNQSGEVDALESRLPTGSSVKARRTR